MSVVDKLSDEQLQDKFEEAFEEQIAKINSIGEYEATCRRSITEPAVKMEVMICGMAGTPISDAFKNGGIENGESVTVDLEDRGEINFTLIPDETTTLNSTDYIVVYRLSE